MMTFYRHTPIIPDDIDTVFLDLPRRKIPVARISNIGLLNPPGIDKEFPLTKFDLLPLQGNDPLQQHHPVPGKAHGDDIKSVHTGEESVKLETEINTSIGIGGLHAAAFDEKEEAVEWDTDLRG